MKKAKCLHCKNESLRRGVCQACYFVAKRRVYRKEITDEKLVQLGFWLPSTRGKRSPINDKIDRLIAASK